VNAVVACYRTRLPALREKAIRLLVVDDRDLVPALDESARQTLNTDSIATETIWGIESCGEAEP
jgi:hypothetical protein